MRKLDYLFPVEICTDMSHLRQMVDGVDQLLVELLAQRMRYMHQAAHLKYPKGLPARIAWRVEDVLNKVRAAAEGCELDKMFIERLWKDIIETSIATEERLLREKAETCSS